MDEGAGLSALSSDLELMLMVDTRPPAGINHGELCGRIVSAITCAKQNVIAFARPVQLPRSFEELKELANDFLVGGIRNDTYHSQDSLTQNSDRLLVRPKPFLE